MSPHSVPGVGAASVQPTNPPPRPMLTFQDGTTPPTKPDHALARENFIEKRAAADTLVESERAGPATRHNDGKPEVALIFEFGSAIRKLTKVMSQGAIKYSPRNWLKGGKSDWEYLHAAARHFEQLVDNLGTAGEYDEDTGVHHAAQIAWNMLAFLRANRDGHPDINPEFDQQAFIDKWNPPSLDRDGTVG